MSSFTGYCEYCHIYFRAHAAYTSKGVTRHSARCPSCGAPARTARRNLDGYRRLVYNRTTNQWADGCECHSPKNITIIEDVGATCGECKRVVSCKYCDDAATNLLYGQSMCGFHFGLHHPSADNLSTSLENLHD